MSADFSHFQWYHVMQLQRSPWVELATVDIGSGALPRALEAKMMRQTASKMEDVVQRQDGNHERPAKQRGPWLYMLLDGKALEACEHLKLQDPHEGER